jgi:hypothetical protein
VVLTDFDGAGNLDSLVAAARLAKSHGHAITFAVPDATAFSPPPVDAVESDLRRVYGRGESRRTREARSILGRLGIPVLPLGPARPRASRTSALEKVA